MNSDALPVGIDRWLNSDPGSTPPGVVNWGPVTHLTDAQGFLRAADLLVKQWPNTPEDYLIKPILFLYRHAIELAFKALVLKVNGLVNQPHSDIEKWLRTSAGHSLVKLLGRARELLSRPELGVRSVPFEEGSPERVLVDQIDELDPRGDEFRYPTSWHRQSSRAVPTRMPGMDGVVRDSVLIDMNAMAEDLSGIVKTIIGVHDWLEYTWDNLENEGDLAH